MNNLVEARGPGTRHASDDRVVAFLAAVPVLFLATSAVAQSEVEGSTSAPSASMASQVIEVGEREHFESPDGLVSVALMLNEVSAGSTPAALSLITAEPGATVPDHVHESSAEILYILAGGGTMHIEGATHRVAPGDVIWIPAGRPHGYTNDGDSVLRALQVYVGPGPEAPAPTASRRSSTRTWRTPRGSMPSSGARIWPSAP